MNFKAKLLSAFCIIIILPLLLMTAVTGAILSYQVNSIQADYGLNTNSVKAITNPIQLLNRATRGIYNDIKLQALNDPAEFEDTTYLDDLNEQLCSKYSFLVVRKDDDILFCGDEELLQKVEDVLPAFGDYSTEVDGGIYIGGEHSFLVKQQDFYFDDGSEGSAFVVTDVNVIVPQIKWTLIQFMVSILIIICFTASILIVWLYRSLLRPLNKLRRATYEIREGNLNYQIKETGDDEIGQLCSDFEEMRVRLKELIEAQIQNEKDTKELISNISHDLKTPLTAIKGYTEGIMDGVADTPQKQDKYLKTIYRKASDMTVLVDELLIYSKIDANTMTYNFTAVDVGEYFKDCIEESSLDAQVKNIQISYTNSVPAGVKVEADAEQLKRVVNNIIGNAVKYMDKEEGRICIDLSELEYDVKVEISDNGQGIAKNDLPHIFDRFYRADASRNSKKGGSGLGLAIVKKVVERHGGTIWADSEEHKGTTIGFTLKKVKEEHKDE